MTGNGDNVVVVAAAVVATQFCVSTKW